MGSITHKGALLLMQTMTAACIEHQSKTHFIQQTAVSSCIQYFSSFCCKHTLKQFYRVSKIYIWIRKKKKCHKFSSERNRTEQYFISLRINFQAICRWHRRKVNEVSTYRRHIHVANDNQQYSNNKSILPLGRIQHQCHLNTFTSKQRQHYIVLMGNFYFYRLSVWPRLASSHCWNTITESDKQLR